MGKEMVINVNRFEIRVAILENHNLSEIFIERTGEAGITGNIYRGKVTKVLPGMQVAFVDIGQKRSGFLHQSDITLIYDNIISETINPAENLNEGMEEEFNPFGAINFDKSIDSIKDLLTEGQELMVQVGKEPIGTKGARITTYITLPGRYLVLMPMINQIGVSRRIESTKERERLKTIVEEFGEKGNGYIIRTAAESVPPEELKRDIEFLGKMWRKVLKKNENGKGPALLYRDLDIVLRSMRDVYGQDIDRIYIDSKSNYERLLEFSDNFLQDIKPKIELYEKAEPIFDAFSLEIEIERAIGRRVWLKSGGYLVIDHAEALTAIDVNTGKYVGKRNQEETIVKTNLEAVKEIVYQLKLRNMGGLIVLDFIDMEREENKEKVYNALDSELKQDRSRTKILRVSELGIVEMTRKRTRANLNRILCQPCPYCDGKGFNKSPKTVCYEIFREIERIAATRPSLEKIMVSASSVVSSSLVDEESDFLEDIEKKHRCTITIKSSKDFSDEQFEVTIT